MVRSQIGSLTSDLSFSHNLCFKCPKCVMWAHFNIYVSRTFQWCKELFNPMSFDPCKFPLKIQESINVTTPLWGKCEVATRIPENGTWESRRTPKNSEHNCRGQNSLHWGVLYIVEKVLKCRCPKWPRMSHLDICSTSYGRKKGRKSNWQFDSRPLKVRNRSDTGVCRWSATHHWKALEESYNFVSNLIPIWA